MFINLLESLCAFLFIVSIVCLYMPRLVASKPQTRDVAKLDNVNPN